MSPALAALYGAVVKAARAGTLKATILDGIALATWAIDHPDEFSMLVWVARTLGFGADALAPAVDALTSGGSAAVESPAMLNAGRPDKRGGR